MCGAALREDLTRRDDLAADGACRSGDAGQAATAPAAPSPALPIEASAPSAGGQGKGGGEATVRGRAVKNF
jgi:hypothetical protein